VPPKSPSAVTTVPLGLHLDHDADVLGVEDDIAYLQAGRVRAELAVPASPVRERADARVGRHGDAGVLPDVGGEVTAPVLGRIEGVPVVAGAVVVQAAPSAGQVGGLNGERASATSTPSSPEERRAVGQELAMGWIGDGGEPGPSPAQFPVAMLLATEYA
jgi:hypothetical protein